VWVSRLRLKAFRNHALTDLTLVRGVTVFVGDNGQGKTNIVESLGYLSDGGSHRVSSDEAIVMFGESEAEVTATITSGERSVVLALTIRAPGANRAQVNSSPTTVTELSSWVNTVFFSPEDIAIIRSDPSHRRRFLDVALVSSQPRFAAVLSEYDRVVRQRNMLLKTMRSSKSTSPSDASFTVWNDALVTLAAEITHARISLIHRLSPFVHDAYADIQPGHEVSLVLSPSHELVGPVEEGVSRAELEDSFRAGMDAVASSEQDRAITLIGPHRDDLVITLNGLPSRTHSSQGEAWSTALALKLGQARFYREFSSSGDPIIILDDVFSELDQRRRRALAEAVSGWEQVLITAAVADDIPETLSGQFVTVEKGVVAGG
jgi:DNA replication and repair protein RecF